MPKKKFLPATLSESEPIHDALTTPLIDIIPGNEQEKLTKLSAAILYSKTGSVKETASTIGVPTADVVRWVTSGWWTRVYHRLDALRSDSLKARFRSVGVNALQALEKRIKDGEETVFVDKASGLVTRIKQEVSTDILIQIAKLGAAFIHDSNATATASSNPAQNNVATRLADMAQTCANIAASAASTAAAVMPVSQSSAKPIIDIEQTVSKQDDAAD